MSTFDLKMDQVREKLAKYVKQRVQKCSQGEYMDLGDPKDPIKLIVFGFNFNQSGYVNLVFDSRPDAESDGEWTCVEDSLMDVEEWNDPIKAYFEEDDQEVEVIISDGKGREKRVSFGSDGVSSLGDVLTGFFYDQCKSGVLKSLNLAPDCEIAVEGFEGDYPLENNMVKYMDVVN